MYISKDVINFGVSLLITIGLVTYAVTSFQKSRFPANNQLPFPTATINASPVPMNTTTNGQPENIPTPSTQSSTPGAITLAVIQSHNTPSDCWMAISGKVYDVTQFIPDHPNDKIILGCGNDATAMFENVRKHQKDALDILPRYEIGRLSQ